MSNSTPVHITVVLDRSGSMAQIADDIVGGFNTFLAEQRRQDGGARVTLIQFDGQDPFEVLIDGVDLKEVADLDPARYIPRGNTPLYDAVGRTVASIDAEIASRADMGQPIEDQVVLVITDGFENASREYSGKVVADLIEARRQRTWAFVFLGSDEASIREAAFMRVSVSNTGRWEATAEGSKEMFDRVSKSTAEYRSMTAEEKQAKYDRFLDDGDEKTG